MKEKNSYDRSPYPSHMSSSISPILSSSDLGLWSNFSSLTKIKREVYCLVLPNTICHGIVKPRAGGT